jgi:hypothetical protein
MCLNVFVGFELEVCVIVVPRGFKFAKEAHFQSFLLASFTRKHRFYIYTINENVSHNTKIFSTPNIAQLNHVCANQQSTQVFPCGFRRDLVADTSPPDFRAVDVSNPNRHGFAYQRWPIVNVNLERVPVIDRHNPVHDHGPIVFPCKAWGGQQDDKK